MMGYKMMRVQNVASIVINIIDRIDHAVKTGSHEAAPWQKIDGEVFIAYVWFFYKTWDFPAGVCTCPKIFFPVPLEIFAKQIERGKGIQSIAFFEGVPLVFVAIFI